MYKISKKHHSSEELHKFYYKAFKILTVLETSEIFTFFKILKNSLEFLKLSFMILIDFFKHISKIF